MGDQNFNPFGELEGVSLCQKCGMTAEAHFSFCPRCGSPVVDESAILKARKILEKYSFPVNDRDILLERLRGIDSELQEISHKLRLRIFLKYDHHLMTNEDLAEFEEDGESEFFFQENYFFLSFDCINTIFPAGLSINRMYENCRTGYRNEIGELDHEDMLSKDNGGLDESELNRLLHHWDRGIGHLINILEAYENESLDQKFISESSGGIVYINVE